MMSDKDRHDDGVIDLKTKSAGGVVPANLIVARLKCFKDVHEMVSRGMYPRQIARVIRDHHGEMRNYSLTDVTEHVRDYRDKLRDEDFQTEDNLDTADNDPQDMAVDALKFIINQQRKRIEMEAATEEKLGKLFSTTHKEVNALSKAAVDLSKVAKTADDGGRSKRVQGAAHGRLPIGRVMKDPEKLRKVMQGFEMVVDDPDLLAEMAEEEARKTEEEKIKKAEKKRSTKKESKKKATKSSGKKKIVRKKVDKKIGKKASKKASKKSNKVAPQPAVKVSRKGKSKR